jgi:hypothetical protein
MVAADGSATYIRELDVFSQKLGFNRGSSLYEVARERELRWNLNKLQHISGVRPRHEAVSCDEGWLKPIQGLES